MLAPITTVGSIKSRPHTPRGTKFVNLHEDFRGKVNKDFARQPSDQGGGGSNSPRPSRYFGLLMVHPSRPPLPPSRPYHWSLNYPKYVKDSNPDAHVKVFKASIKTIVKQMMQKLLICKVLPLKILCLIGVIKNWEII